MSRVKIGSGVENTCGGASAALKCGVDRQGGRHLWSGLCGAASTVLSWTRLTQLASLASSTVPAVDLMHAKCPSSAAVVRL